MKKKKLRDTLCFRDIDPNHYIYNENYSLSKKYTIDDFKTNINNTNKNDII
jgi:hypothetical protein